MTIHADDNTLRQQLQALKQRDVQQLELRLSADLPGRRQTVRIARQSGSELIADTTISTDADDELRNDIFRWNNRYPLVTFRLADRQLSAQIQIAANISIDEQHALIGYLARLADQLEYDIAKGRDVH